MAYSPGQPWDPTLSYTSGQTCTYNGLPYVFWRPEPYASTVGVAPNVEEAMFEAKSIDGMSSSYKMMRAWVIGDKYSIGGTTFYARYGNVRAEQPEIRGINANLSNYSAPFVDAEYTGLVYAGVFPTPKAEDTHYSWGFYGQPIGMSSDYDTGGFSGSIVARSIEEGYETAFAPPLGNGLIPTLQVTETTYDGAGNMTIKVIFILPGPAVSGTVNFSALYSCFDKVGNFSVLDGSGNVITTSSANSGNPRDGYLEPANYTPTSLTFPVGFYSLRLDSITPSFSS